MVRQGRRCPFSYTTRRPCCGIRPCRKCEAGEEEQAGEEELLQAGEEEQAVPVLASCGYIIAIYESLEGLERTRVRASACVEEKRVGVLSCFY